MAVADFEKMGNVEQENKVLDWDTKLEDIPEDDHSLFRVVPEGDYDFEVDEILKQYSKSNLPMVLVQLIIFPVEGNKVRVDDRIVLTEKMRWKLNQFFKSIGQFEEAQKTGMNWDKVVHGKGRLTITHRTYDGKTYNQVKAYIVPAQAAVQVSEKAGMQSLEKAGW